MDPYLQHPASVEAHIFLFEYIHEYYQTPKYELSTMPYHTEPGLSNREIPCIWGYLGV